MRARPLVVSTALLAALGSTAFAGPVAPSHEAVIYLGQLGFSQRSSTIAPSDRIRFTVRDHRNHQVWKKTGSAAGDVPPNILEGQGSSVTLGPVEPGSYVYVDRLNPSTREFHLFVRR